MRPAVSRASVAIGVLLFFSCDHLCQRRLIDIEGEGREARRAAETACATRQPRERRAVDEAGALRAGRPTPSYVPVRVSLLAAVMVNCPSVTTARAFGNAGSPNWRKSMISVASKVRRLKGCPLPV